MTKHNSTKVLVVYPSNKFVQFSSIAAASRALSGNGSEGLSRTIRRRLQAGGGYVASTQVWVQSA